MILATVGTSRFDELVEAIDRIAPNLNEEVIIQVGNQRYVPKNCKYFTFADSLMEYFRRADIVIAHGGAGITFEVLNLGIKLISIENPYVLEGHQRDLLEKLAREGYLVWCKDVKTLEVCIEKVRKKGVRKYKPPECWIGKRIAAYLG